MILFPAIDIQNGKCVRLTQGDYNQETIYHERPVEVAKSWEREQAAFLHIVDLNGAKTGKSINEEVIKEIARSVSTPVQVGGGIRSLEIIDTYLQAGAARVKIGRASCRDRGGG